MSKKKLQYRNFNVCQLVDKGKIKLQYTDEFKQFTKKYSENKFKENNAFKYKGKKYIVEDVNEDLYLSQINPFNNFNIANTLGCVMYDPVLRGTISYDELKEHCKFIEINNELNDDKNFGILLFDKFILMNEIFPDGKKLNINYENQEDIVSYLINFDMTKKEYTFAELREILNIYIETKEKDKQLIK